MTVALFGVAVLAILIFAFVLAPLFRPEERSAEALAPSPERGDRAAPIMVPAHARDGDDQLVEEAPSGKRVAFDRPASSDIT